MSCLIKSVACELLEKLMFFAWPSKFKEGPFEWRPMRKTENTNRDMHKTKMFLIYIICKINIYLYSLIMIVIFCPTCLLRN